MSEVKKSREYAARSLRSVWVGRTTDTGWVEGRRDTGTYMELRYVLRPPWERFWRWLVRWEPCRVYWGSHGCDKRRGHLGGHRCGGIVRDRCCRGYEAPPRWAPWRRDTTRYFGEDA